MRLLGVDGCPAGWIVAESTPVSGARRLAAPSFWIARSFGELLARVGNGPAIVCVDIPIGLASGRPCDDGVRAADRAARAFLGSHRAPSVFSAPCRPTLEAATYLEACAAEMAARGVKLSRQAFGILPKIRDVDRTVTPAQQADPGMAPGPVVRESHPEVAFAMLKGNGKSGHGLVEGKRTAAGEAVRLALLEPSVGTVDITEARRELIASARGQDKNEMRRVVGRDDIVDALACLVVAQRVATGEARTFPDDPPQTDARGLRMEILA